MGGDATPRVQAAPGRDRSLQLPASLQESSPPLAEEPDGCGGGREASLAPWPRLNIYYVLFGLSGRGGEGCHIDPELQGEAGPAQGRGRCRGREPGVSRRPLGPRAPPKLPGDTDPPEQLTDLGCGAAGCGERRPAPQRGRDGEHTAASPTRSASFPSPLPDPDPTPVSKP